MYHRPFFPDEIFGWTFFGVLAALTVVAAVIDLRKMVVPKWLTIPTLVLGLVFNTARGAFLGYEEMRVWALTPDGPFLGALDGFLFALVGFLCGFAMFFVMWVLGLCGVAASLLAHDFSISVVANLVGFAATSSSNCSWDGV